VTHLDGVAHLRFPRSMPVPLAIAQFVAIVPGLLVMGVGIGMKLTASVNVAQSSFPSGEQGDISGLSRSASGLGSSLGTAVVGSILVASTASGRGPYASMAPEEWRTAVFELDRDMVLRSDLVLCVLDGRVPDAGGPGEFPQRSGVCVELGMAYACRWMGRAPKTIVGLLTDRRAAFLGEKLNPMVARPLDHRVESEEELLSLVRSLVGGGP
jgi:hypothetical protein